MTPGSPLELDHNNGQIVHCQERSAVMQTCWGRMVVDINTSWLNKTFPKNITIKCSSFQEFSWWSLSHWPLATGLVTTQGPSVMWGDVRGNLWDDSGVRARVTGSHYMLRYYCRITSHGVIDTFLEITSPSIQRISSITSLNKAHAAPSQQCIYFEFHAGRAVLIL